MVFDGVVSSTFQNVGNVCPLIGLISIEKIEDPLFLDRPRNISLDHWVEVVVPSLTALLSDSPRQVTSYLSPFLGAIDVNQME